MTTGGAGGDQVDPDLRFPDPGPGASTAQALAVACIASLVEGSATVATAESLTGGALCAALTAVPGASRVVLGGVVSYDTTVKARMLDVPEDLLRARGAVDPRVAQHMAEGLARRWGADFTVATTGVAGPDPAPGGTEVGEVEPGVVFIAVHGPAGTVVEQSALTGDRDAIRDQVVVAALHTLQRHVRLAAR